MAQPGAQPSETVAKLLVRQGLLPGKSSAETSRARIRSLRHERAIEYHRQSDRGQPRRSAGPRGGRGRTRTVYYLEVAEPDMGKVIGKQGRIANAMRALLKVAAARQGVRRASLEIGE